VSTHIDIPIDIHIDIDIDIVARGYVGFFVFLAFSWKVNINNMQIEYIKYVSCITHVDRNR